jgi:hypothetical protein
VRALLEAESAALGAALQAQWCVRRAAGESTLSTDAVAAPFVQLGAASLPEAHWHGAHSALRARFDAALRRLHPDPR